MTVSNSATEPERNVYVLADARARGQIVPSVGRAVMILRTLAAGPPTATLAGLSAQLELPRSSTLALCNTLVATGLLVRDHTKAYRLGPGVLELSRAYLDQTGLPVEFQRLCRELHALPEQTLVLSVLEGTDAIYIAQRRGSLPVGVSYALGVRLPANCTASGKALLASLPAAELETLYATRGALPALTSNSIVEYAALDQILADVRRNGYAIDDEETALGMMCVGVPVHDGAGRVVAAIAASMPKAALRMERLPHMVAEIQRLAGRLQASLG